MDISKACEILQIDQKASIKEAKKVYRRLALKWHPDKYRGSREEAPEKFTQIGSALNCFKKFCDNDFSNSENQPPPPPPPKPQQPIPNERPIKLTLEEINNGCTKLITFPRVNNSRGIWKNANKDVKVTFPRGSIDETRITIAKKGDKNYGKIPTVVLVVRELAHSVFTRNRFDLVYTAELTLEQACSGQITVPTIDKTMIKFATCNVITQSTLMKADGKGLPVPNPQYKRGDLVVKFKIIYDHNMEQDPPIMHEVVLTLEQMLKGNCKTFKFTRTIVDPKTQKNREELKQIIVNFAPGTRRIVLEKEGNQYLDTIPSDVILVVKAKPHAYFTLDGIDLKCSMLISIDEFNNGCTLEISTLENEFISLKVNRKEISQVIFGRGLPSSENVRKRGNIIVDFNICHKIDPPIEHKLSIALEDILKGQTKRIKIIRQIFNKELGHEITVERIVTIQIKPGTESGTKFTFCRMADQHVDSIAADLVFIVCDKPHEMFKRVGANLEYTAKFTRRKMNAGELLEIPTLDGDTKKLFLSEKLIRKEKQFLGKGLPLPNDQNKRGHLLVRFEMENEL